MARFKTLIWLELVIASPIFGILYDFFFIIWSFCDVFPIQIHSFVLEIGYIPNKALRYRYKLDMLLH